jgi:hypothetical protein
VVALAGFGSMVVLRSAYLQRPMTDLQVYARAAWAVRSGADVYAVMDDNKWHYHYPTLFAIAMAPLADAPPGADRTGMLPFGLTALVWFLFSLLCAALAVHWLASALEAVSSDPAVRGQPRGCRRWWHLRAWPLWACLVPVGETLVRGQVNLLVLALVCGMMAAALRGRPFRAGLWLAGAICIKIIPAFLLLGPLWRCDRRWLAGAAAGLMAGLLLIPAAVLGPRQTWEYTVEWGRVLLLPALDQGGDRARDKELIETMATDSQSPVRVLHCFLYPDPYQRPENAAPWVRQVHWVVGIGLTLITLWAAGRRNLDGPGLVLFLGCLIFNMNMLSPVCHQHYFCLMVPTVMALLVFAWEPERPRWLRVGLGGVLPAFFILTMLPLIPDWAWLRDFGLAGFGALLVWGLGCIVLRMNAGARPALAQLGNEQPLAA